MYELKSYRGVLCHDNIEWCKIWIGIDLSVQNWQISKICTLMGSFWPEYMFELKKSTEELFLMALNIDAKFEAGMTCAFKNDMKNLANFHQNMFESLKIGTLMGSFYLK